MTRFRVSAALRTTATVIVEAADAEEARDLALDDIENGARGVEYMDEGLWETEGTPEEVS